MGPPAVLTQSEFIGVSQIRSTWACVDHISLIRTQNHAPFLCLDSLLIEEFEICFYQSDLPIGNRLIKFNGFQLKFIIRASSNSEHLSLFLSCLPHPNSKSCTISFFLDSLLFKEHSVKFSYFFSIGSTSWELYSRFVWPACLEHCFC